MLYKYYKGIVYSFNFSLSDIYVKLSNNYCFIFFCLFISFNLLVLYNLVYNRYTIDYHKRINMFYLIRVILN